MKTLHATIIKPSHGFNIIIKKASYPWVGLLLKHIVQEQGFKLKTKYITNKKITNE